MEEPIIDDAPSEYARTRGAVQDLLGAGRLVTNAYIVAEVIDVETLETSLILRFTEDIPQWSKEGMLAYALRCEQGLVTLVQHEAEESEE